MAMRPWLSVMVAILLSSCATAPAHAPQIDDANDALAYYPLLPGWGWAYDLERDGATVLALYAVVERRRDFAVVAHAGERLEYDLTAAGIARHDGGDYILRAPVRGAASWPIAAGTASIVEVAKSVTVPAGSFRDCVVVEEARHAPERVARTTYCRGVGPVEIEVRVLNPATVVFDVAARARLRMLSRPEDTL